MSPQSASLGFLVFAGLAAATVTRPPGGEACAVCAALAADSECDAGSAGGGCALHALQLRRSALSPSPAPAASGAARRPIIIDADMDADDVMAIAYLLNHPGVDVRAITVTADGWSDQWAGVMSAMRVTQKFNQPDIPVAFQAGYLGQTQLNKKYPNDMPPSKYLAGKNLTGTDNFVTYWVPTPFNDRPPAWQSAPQLLLQTLRAAPDGVDILALGPLTNLADALHTDAELFTSKVRTIYASATAEMRGLSGAAAAEAGEDEARLMRRRMRVAQPPVYSSPDSLWNVLADPIAASQVLSAGLHYVVMSLDAENMITVNETDHRYIPQACAEEQRQYLTALYEQFGPATRQKMSALRYWDPSAAVLMMQLLESDGRGPAPVCAEWLETHLSVFLDMNEPQRYATTFESPHGSPVRICRTANVTNFKVAYYTGGCGL